MTKSDAHQDIEVWDLIAAQYVLGTLTASARQNFEFRLQENMLLRELTYDWERRLNPLAESLQPEVVPEVVWQNITQRLGFVATIPNKRHSLLQHNVFQRWWGAGMSALAASIVMFVLYSTHMLSWPDRQQQSVYVEPVHDIAVLSSNTKQQSWVVRQQGNKLLLSAIHVNVIPPDKDLELWSVQEHGQPRSLGVLHVQHGQVVVSQVLPELIKNNVTLAISLEPKHGSPTGKPTGAILYTGKITRT